MLDPRCFTEASAQEKEGLGFRGNLQLDSKIFPLIPPLGFIFTGHRDFDLSCLSCCRKVPQDAIQE